MDLLKVDSDIVLCQQGEVADQMFLLMTGKCVALVDGAEVGRLKKLDVFGESALFDNGKRSATVVTCQDNNELLVLTRDNLNMLIQSGDLDKQCVAALEAVAKERKAINQKVLKKNACKQVEEEKMNK